MWRFSPRKARRTGPGRRPSTYRLKLEYFEDRCLPSAGYLDPTFGAAGTGLVAQGAKSVLIQPDGKILAFPGGSFTGAVPVTRYNTDGSLDATLGSGGTAQVNFGAGDTVAPGADALQPDRKILMAAVVRASNNTIAFELVRLNSNGSPDTTFGNQGEVTTSFNNSLDWQEAATAGVVVQSDGKIVLVGGNGGRLINGRALEAFDVARYNANGSLDTSFGNQGLVVTSFPQVWAARAHNLLLQPNGQLIVAGYSDEGGTLEWLLARYNPGGSLDTTSGNQGIVTIPSGSQAEGSNTVDGAILYPNAVTPNDGKIVVVGNNTSLSPGPLLARLNTNGSVDTTFGSGGFAQVGVQYPSGAAFDATGRFAVAGSTLVSSSNQMALERLNPDGTPDTTFGGGGVVTLGLPGTEGAGLAIYPASGTATADAGKIVAAGSHVARFLPTAPPSAPSFLVTGPASTTAGAPFAFTVTATDANGNALTGYAGTVDFGSIDPQAVLPPNYTFTAADQGVHTFTATLKTAALQALFVADTMTPSINGRDVSLLVNPGAATHFIVSGPSSVKSGTAFWLAAEPWTRTATKPRATAARSDSAVRTAGPRCPRTTPSPPGVAACRASGRLPSGRGARKRSRSPT
jgi:uncharacterized delta-60 repeat protein